jgi:hypothetical protein
MCSLGGVSPHSVTELRASVKGGARPEYLHFWGHQPRSDGTVRGFDQAT